MKTRVPKRGGGGPTLGKNSQKIPFFLWGASLISYYHALLKALSNLAISPLILSPSLHDKGIVNRDADDLVDTLCLHIGSSFNIPWQVGLAAARSESSWHPEDHNLAQTTALMVN